MVCHLGWTLTLACFAIMLSLIVIRGGIALARLWQPFPGGKDDSLALVNGLAASLVVALGGCGLAIPLALGAGIYL
ncbi:MAG TPA: hypothetical protein VIY86_13290, partial [Pirellulaceae bacterium]